MRNALASPSPIAIRRGFGGSKLSYVKTRTYYVKSNPRFDITGAANRPIKRSSTESPPSQCRGRQGSALSKATNARRSAFACLADPRFERVFCHAGLRHVDPIDVYCTYVEKVRKFRHIGASCRSNRHVRSICRFLDDFSTYGVIVSIESTYAINMSKKPRKFDINAWRARDEPIRPHSAVQ